jgi:hypothetical protein
MKDAVSFWAYTLRMKLANFISGGDLQMYASLYEAHSTMRVITNSIAMQAVNQDTIEAAREFYHTEFQAAEDQHFERVFKILENGK